MDDPCPLCGVPGGAGLEAQGVLLRRCPACGTLRQARFPSEAELSAIYGASYYDSWGSLSEGEVEAMKRATFAPLLRRLGRRASPPGDLLDVGCATGFLMAEAEAQGWRAHGVELNPWSAERAVLRFPGRVRRAGAEDAPRAGSPFRAVTLVDVFEHLPRPRKALAHLRDLLEPGGWILLAVPDAGSPSLKLLRGHWPHFKKEHLFYPTRRGLAAALEAEGFSSAEFFPVPKTATLGYLARQFDAYPRPLVTSAARLFLRRAPRSLREARVTLPSGELGVIARRS